MDFVFVSGNLALDLLGTLKWRRTHPEEGLTTPGDAARWALAAGVLTQPPSPDGSEFEQLIAVRESIYRLVEAARNRTAWPGPDLRELNAAANRPLPMLALAAGGAHRTGPLGAVTAEVARAAIALLDEWQQSTPPRVRECERPECTRVFIDRSRAGTRNWCGMAECGNRVKAREYRARKAARQPQG
ncbi:CGNR zinc finger domain-containing protein [Actinoplanes sp. NPDC020271]|uniref:CGNR zinc finger domain-containing protein n=1 Tax=Actinoplanes sp. NPDC020271 TaxID=3363896 RepID=UPI00379987B3